jgi:catechol 2,3-dioxygenase-like lactoylglutathione lyase family enzyme
MAEAKLRAICPIFQVSNLERGIEFYTRVMGFELSWTWGDPPDRASLCRDAVEITLEVEANPILSHAYIQVKASMPTSRVSPRPAPRSSFHFPIASTACATDVWPTPMAITSAWAR